MSLATYHLPAGCDEFALRDTHDYPAAGFRVLGCQGNSNGRGLWPVSQHFYAFSFGVPSNTIPQKHGLSRIRALARKADWVEAK